MKKFKFLEHTADIKFQAFGKNLEEVFVNSALAMVNSICDEKVQEIKNFKINVNGIDLPSLLYNFLEELLFLFESEYFILSNIKNIKINSKKFNLIAEVTGDTIKKYDIHLDIKAVTYNEMFVKKLKGTYVAQVVLDV